MNKLNDEILKIKEVANSILNENTPKADADKVALINEKLDGVIKENENTLKEYDSLKNDYINLIKKSGSNKVIENNITEEDSNPIENEVDFNKALNKFVNRNKK